MNFTQPLKFEIEEKGTVWWKNPKIIVSSALLHNFLDEELSTEDKEDAIRNMRRMGKTFQACLLACRHLLSGAKVSFRTHNQDSAKNAYMCCANILEQSFGRSLDYLNFRSTPSCSISFPLKLSVIQFTYNPAHERGLSVDIVIEDEMEYSAIPSKKWDYDAPTVNSKDHLINVLKGNV